MEASRLSILLVPLPPSLEGGSAGVPPPCQNMGRPPPSKKEIALKPGEYSPRGPPPPVLGRAEPGL
ncbi:MAG: hypothetical protein Kow0025_11480 [Thermodesulfovibrionales bacterium]